MSLSIYNAIKIEYEKRQKFAHDSLEERKKSLYQLHPRFEQIETEVRQLGLKCNKMILTSAKPADELRKELFDALECLKREKASLLTQLGYPNTYLDITYQCSHCKDTGYIDKSGKLIIQPQYDRAGMFDNGLARVTIGNKEGYINTSGNYVWPLTEQPKQKYKYGRR